MKIKITETKTQTTTLTYPHPVSLDALKRVWEMEHAQEIKDGTISADFEIIED